VKRALIAVVFGPLAACGRDEPVPSSDAGMGPELATIPVGLDAYRQWERLPYLRFGVRAYMRSTYDRSGGNEAADASHFLRQESEDRNVTLDVAGSGVLYFTRTNHWHGSPWHYVIDGTDHVVRESSTADPNNPVDDSVFLPEAPFPNPLTWTWSTTRGADLNWVPMPFERTLSLAYERTHYGTGYYIYHLFADARDDLSAPIQSFQAEAPGDDVLELLRRAGEDIAPRGAGVTTREGTAALQAAATITLVELDDGPAMLRALKLSIPRERALEAAAARLRITWDGRSEPSVDAPLALFFGTGSLYNRNGAEYLVRGMLSTVRFTETEVELATYFPMPYAKKARIELIGAGIAVGRVAWHARSVAYRDPLGWVGHFHATYVDHAVPVVGKDLVVLDTATVEGGGDYCGSFVGMSWIFSERAMLSTLEGDPRFFFDDSRSPQAYGTGTEEWAGGGDYWGGRTMTLPLAGHPVGAPSAAAAHNAEDQIESAYRFLVADAMPFGKNARIQLEHGGNNESVEHYRSVAYWYGTPRACLVLTDSLDVGDPADEARHAYHSPAASSVETLTSRYEWGVDRLGDLEIFPETSDSGRHTKGTSEFTLAIDPQNVGVLLRRKLDYGFVDQRAEVSIADGTPGAAFQPVGIWYLAGSNTSVYSNPPEELGAAEHIVQTSNRRFRDDEFLLPRALTGGRRSIRVRIVFSPRPRPLYPGGPQGETAWSELHYSAYSYVLP
jgi:hypothetical protein